MRLPTTPDCLYFTLLGGSPELTLALARLWGSPGRGQPAGAPSRHHEPRSAVGAERRRARPAVVAQVPTVLCFPASVAWAVGHMPLVLAVVFHSKRPTERMEMLGAYSAFYAFGLLVSWIHLQERRARRELAETNAVLLSTRALLVEGSRHGERLRTSRELHDSLGHDWGKLLALFAQRAKTEKVLMSDIETARRGLAVQPCRWGRPYRDRLPLSK
jgi:hypothetical protein